MSTDNQGMAIGNGKIASADGLNQIIGQFAVQLRVTYQGLDDFVTWFNTLDLATIQTAFGLSLADAQTMQAVVGNMASLSKIYHGQAQGLTLPFDFRTNSGVLWGGQ